MSGQGSNSGTAGNLPRSGSREPWGELRSGRPEAQAAAEREYARMVKPVEHFVPTSTHYNWRGKVRCAYCTATGWPLDGSYRRHWSHKHGANCSKRVQE